MATCDRCNTADATRHVEWRQPTDPAHWSNKTSDRCDRCARALHEYAALPQISLVVVIDEELAPNPIVRETPLRAYPGWVVREYADGVYDATDGFGLTLGVGSFAEAVAEVRGEVGRATCIGEV